jgi:hypothetical protein
MSDVVKTEQASAPAEPSPEVNFALVLSRMIDSLEQDPVQLRAAVYELARVKLKEQFGREDAHEVNRLVGALETAIAGLETFSLQQAAAAPAAALPAPRQAEAPSQRRLGRLNKKQQSFTAEVPDASVQASLARGGAGATAPKTPAAFGSIARLAAVLAVVVSVGLGVVLWPRLKLLVRPGAATSTVATAAVRTPPPPATLPDPVTMAPALKLDYPLPSTFGIYALTDQQLFELKPLAGKIPDRRVAMSAPISGSSKTILPNGNARFIVFRRDAATNAPDNAEVRVIAKVTRSMGIDPTSKAMVVAPAQDSFVIRNFSLPYKTGPIPEHPEMYLIQPDSSDASLPPGRYGLVIKGQGFDFAVDGPVTDARQCVERIDAVNGAFYTPCPDKR